MCVQYRRKSRRRGGKCAHGSVEVMRLTNEVMRLTNFVSRV
jgi:hypothetical protein